MAKATTEMTVIAKLYDLVLWTSNHVARFPRSHRFTIGSRLENRLYDMLDALLRAKYDDERLMHLRQVNMNLELLRFQVRLAKDLKCLSLDSYGFAATSLDEIGRMVGSWLKRTTVQKIEAGNVGRHP